jgi:hypothetical protein
MKVRYKNMEVNYRTIVDVLLLIQAQNYRVNVETLEDISYKKIKKLCKTMSAANSVVFKERCKLNTKG